MNTTSRNLSLIILFVVSFAYLFWFGNYIFNYQDNNTLFIYSKDYFQKFASKPGGLLVYTSNFLSQWFYNYMYGSLLLSTLLVLLCIVFIKIYNRLATVSQYILIFILSPSCLILLLQIRFDLPIQYDLGYLLATVWFLVSILPQKKYFRFFILILFPLFYYFAGSFALIYLGMYILYFIIFETGMLRFLPAIITAMALTTLIIFKKFLFFQPFDQLLGYPLSFHGSSMITLCLDCLSGLIVLFPVFIITSSQFNVSPKNARFVPIASLVAVFAITVVMMTKVYNPGLANLMKLEKSVHNQDWDSVIRQHEKFPSSSIYGQYYYNLALSEKNQLCDRMFYGRQSFGPMSLTLPPDLDQAGRTVYFYYAVGLISEAHHLAYELMVTHGYRPENIKLLIKTELINGNYKIAGQYIQVLKKTLHYRKWAEKCERMVRDPALINKDPELYGKIMLLPKGDFFIGSNDVQNLDSLLKKNPDNKRAFEYKMARLLLEKDFVEVVNEAKKMKDMGYTSLPRHIEEAVVEFMHVTKRIPDLGGLTLSPGIMQRFIQYSTDYSTYGNNKSMLEKRLTNAEKSTYWFYLQNTKVSTDFLKRKPVDNNIY